MNNAGMMQTGHPEDLSGDVVASTSHAERFERDLALNLKTAFNVSRARSREYRARATADRHGELGHRAGRDEPGERGYAAAKAGMDGLMRTIALENGRSGITCNSVLPGWIATGSQLDEEDVAGRNTPIGRSGTPDEVAARHRRVPRVRGRELRHRPRDGRGRRQHDPGVQGTGRGLVLGGARRLAASGRVRRPPLDATVPDALLRVDRRIRLRNTQYVHPW